MNLVKDVWVFFKAMATLPWPIQVWATLYPFPQILGGLYFIQTLPGFVIFSSRVLSFIVASQVHKREPFSKMMGPVGHAHWLLVAPYLIYELRTQNLSSELYWFIVYVLATTAISAVIDVKETADYVRRGHAPYRR